MTKRIGNVIVLEGEQSQQCDYCGKIAELRPYGKNGACICFECGMANEEETARNFAKVLGWNREQCTSIIVPLEL